MKIRNVLSQSHFAGARLKALLIGLIAASMVLLGFAAPARAAVPWDWFGVPDNGSVVLYPDNKTIAVLSPTCAPRLLATQPNGTVTTFTLGTQTNDFYGARGCYSSVTADFNTTLVTSYQFSSASGDVSAQVVPPVAVTNFQSTPADRSFSTTWTAPQNAKMIAYYYYYLLDNESGGVIGAGQIDRTATSATIRTPRNSEGFYFQLIPFMYIGKGIEAKYPVVANIAPLAPARTSIYPGDKQLQITFDPAVNDPAAIANYNVVIQPGDIRMTIPTTQRNFTVTSGIANNVDYQVSVAAVNSIGQSAWTDSNVVTTRAMPTPVTQVKAAAVGTAGAQVSWNASATDVTGYKVRSISTGEVIDVGPTTTVATFSNLLANSIKKPVYEFSVTAVNDYLSSSAVATLTSFIPDAPSGVVATGGFKSMTVDWSEPGNTQTPIIGYVVELLSANNTVNQRVVTTNNSTHLVIGGLAVDDHVRARVSTITGWGTSIPSAQSNVGIAQGAPGAASYSTVSQIASNTGTVDVSLGSIATHGCALTTWSIHAAWNGTSQDAVVPARNVVYRMSGLPFATPITFTVTPTNCWGDGPSTTLTKTLSSLPEPVSNVQSSVTASGDLAITWTPSPSVDVTSVALTLTPGNQTISVSPRTIRAVFTGVTFGQSYRVTITPQSGAGAGAPTTSASTLIATVPGPVQDLRVTLDAATTTAHISWTAPLSTGSRVTSYTVWVDSQAEQVTTETSADITGLVPGEQHSFSVIATNSLGDGETASIAFGLPAPVVVDPDGTGTVVIWALPSSLRSVKTVVVQKRTGTSAWKSIAKVTANKGKYAIKKSTANTKYRVRAVVSKKKSVTLKIKLVRK